MREAEGKRRASRSEAIAVISLIVFIIVFQLVTFTVSRLAPVEEGEDLSYTSSLPDKDSSHNGGRLTVTGSGLDSCTNIGDNGANRKKQGLSGSRIIKVRQNNTPYGHRQYGYKKAAVIELNSADSAALVTLYGIGPYFAKRILEYRERLGGSYVSVFQLLEIKGIDSTKFVSIRKRIKVDGSVRKFSIAESDFDFLRRNPYIGYASAKKIIAFREEHGTGMCRLDILLDAGILNKEQVELLKAYVTD